MIYFKAATFASGVKLDLRENEWETDPAEWMEFRLPLFPLTYRWFGFPAEGRKAEPLVWGGAGSC